MNGLNKFENNLFELVVDTKKGEPLFDVETVAKSLGFTEFKNEKEYVRWRTINGYLKKYVSQEVAKGDFIPESMVYKLAFKANNVLADRGQWDHPRGCAAEGERNTEGANEMKILTDEAEDKLVSIIGTAIVLIIAILIIGLIGWVEVGM